MSDDIFDEPFPADFFCNSCAHVRYTFPTGSTCAVGCTTRPAKSKDCPNWKRAPGGLERGAK